MYNTIVQIFIFLTFEYYFLEMGLLFLTFNVVKQIGVGPILIGNVLIKVFTIRNTSRDILNTRDIKHLWKTLYNKSTKIAIILKRCPLLITHRLNRLASIPNMNVRS